MSSEVSMVTAEIGRPKEQGRPHPSASAGRGDGRPYTPQWQACLAAGNTGESAASGSLTQVQTE